MADPRVVLLPCYGSAGVAVPIAGARKLMKPTEAQRRALESCVKHGSPTYHLHGMSAWGGWGATREALMRRGWMDSAFQITPAGRQAIGLPGDLGGSLAESSDD